MLLVLLFVTSLVVTSCAMIESVFLPVSEEEIEEEFTIIQLESEFFNDRLFHGSLFASNLCVTIEDVPSDLFSLEETTMSAAVFSLMKQDILFSHNIHKSLYPASTTKIVTAYVALKYGNLEDVITFVEEDFNLVWDAARGGFEVGDQVTMHDLLKALMVSSSNDAAIAIARHIAGTEEAFAELMNEELRRIGATNSNYVNSHGLHDDRQYTTIYDLYLVFNAALLDERFLDLIQIRSHTITVEREVDQEGVIETALLTLVFEPTNWYFRGEAIEPEGIRVIGGKTGTTRQAGRCVVLYVYDANSNPYISIIMGAENHDVLYQTMNEMFVQVILSQ